MTIAMQTSPAPQSKHVLAGQAGYYEWSGIAAFSTTDLTGTLDCPFPFIDEIILTPIGGSTNYGTLVVPIDAGSISATYAAVAIAPITGTVAFVKFVTATVVTANDTNYWTFGLLNKTATLTPVDATVAANSTKATGGTGTTAYAVKTLTNNATPAQLVVSQYDVMEVNITKNSSATTMAEGHILLGFQGAGAGTEDLYVDQLSLISSGQIVRSGTTIKIGRRGGVVTSGLAFSFQIRGRAC